MTCKIIAHRGASDLAPENTMPAFQLAYKMGAEGIETDVQLTKDHVPILIHDEHLKRTTSGTGYVKDLTFTEIKQLDAGSWFSKSYVGTSILSLEEFLQWAKDKSLYLNIELKNNKIEYKHLESIVYEMLEHFSIVDRTTLSTFNPASVLRMNDKLKKIEIAFLTSKQNKTLITSAKELGAHALHIKYKLLNAKTVYESHKQNLPLRIYTVNRLGQMMKCFGHSCDGIITDMPNKALQARKIFT